MSGQPSVSQEAVEQTKQQIRAIVNEIAALGRSGVPAEEYYPQLLQRVISALAAVGGAIWILDRDQQPRLQYQQNVSQSLLEDQSDDAAQHNRLVRRLIASGQPQLIPPLTRSGEEGNEAGNPTRYLLVVAPLRADKHVEGLIEIFQRPDSQPITQQGYLKFLSQMAELAGEWLRGSKLRAFSDRQQLWQQADTFARAVHDSIDLRETAYVVANEGRRLIGCDRVSVALSKGRRCRVEAISGQDTVENRSNVVSALSQLATRVVATGEPLWYDGSTQDLPPQLEEAIEQYVDQSYARSIAVLPLRQPARGQQRVHSGATGEIDRDDSHRGEVLGALIVEQIESDLPDDVLRQRVGVVYEHSTRALSNAVQHNSLFLMPVWRALGKASWILKARTLPKTLAVAGLLAAVVAGLVLIPMEHQLEANGSLQPDIKENVFAPQENCEVIEVLVDHGTEVRKGQRLLQLRNRDLEKQLEDVLGEIRVTDAEASRVRSELTNSPAANRLERKRLEGEAAEIRAKAESLQRQLEILRQKEFQLTITSPIDGQVMTWDVEESLLNRPVTTGQVLVTIADPKSSWHLELLMPEKRMSHFDRGLKVYPEGMPVDYILATDPDRTLRGRVENSSLRTRLDSEEGHVVEVRVKPDELPDQMEMHPGARVIADVHVGKRASGFALFHEVAEWLYTMIF